MYLLYLDESGSVADASQQYFVLAGVSVFERATHWLEQDLNKIAERFAPGAPHTIELHGSPMRGGRDAWRGVPFPERMEAMKDALRAAVAPEKGRRAAVLFGSVVKKNVLVGADPVEHSFELLSARFDSYLRRLYLKHDNKQRGMMLFDKASTELRIQTLARDFKYNGHAGGKTRNFAEVPVFLDSKASRLIQLADLVAFALYRHFEHADSQLYDVIKDAFDHEGAVVHGLDVLQ